MREEYNIWKTQDNVRENKKYFNNFDSLYIWFYVLLFIITLYKVHKYLI